MNTERNNDYERILNKYDLNQIKRKEWSLEYTQIAEQDKDYQNRMKDYEAILKRYNLNSVKKKGWLSGY